LPHSCIIHRGEERIRLDFPYDKFLIEKIRLIPGSAWSQSKRCWLIPRNKNSLIHLRKVLPLTVELKEAISIKPVTEPELISLTDTIRPTLQKFNHWMRSKRYSDNTIAAYTDALKAFLVFYIHKPVTAITNEDVIEFNNAFILKKRLSASYQSQVVNAIKLFFKTVERRSINIELIHRPKKPKLLPNVLSKEGVKLVLNSHNNLKHKAMLSLIYSCGLRCGELLRLKPSDIDSKRQVLLIRQSKGQKDRIAPLSSKIVLMLREYYVAYKPGHYLFEGQTKGSPYSARSLQSVLKQAVIKVRIKKPVSLHWLRHSYATHLLENGTDLRYIQEILGHSSSRTTEIYTHVSTKNIQKIISPFDYL
jgi:integrase/recombinase XerD